MSVASAIRSRMRFFSSTASEMRFFSGDPTVPMM